MHKHYVLLPFLLFLTTHLFAGNDKNSLGGRSAGMGNASVTFSDGFSVFANQAGLARLQTIDAGLYAENRFMLKDLGMYALGVGIPTKSSGTFGVGVSYFGSDAYNEQQVSLGYGRLLFKKLSIGAAFEFRNYSLAEQGSKPIFTFGVGLLYNLNDKLAIGANIYNPINWQLTDSDEDVAASIIKLGASFMPSDRITIVAEAEKNIDKAMQFKAGLEYNLISKLYLRGGFGTQPSSTSFGIGLNLSPIKIDLAGSFHPTLGYSPSISISFTGKKKKEEVANEKL